MDRITQLQNILARAAQAYYYTTDRTVVMPEDQYEQLKAELKQLDPNNPELTRIGAPVPADGILTKAKHQFLMGSLANAMNEQEFRKWANEIGPVKMVLQPKLDGLSIGLQYEDGRLTAAITRGDGEYGELVTSNAAQFKGVPLTLTEPFTGSVRGEALLELAEWRKIDPNEESNARNMAAGICRRKDGSDAHRISFHAFDIVPADGRDYVTEEGKLAELRRLGFTVPPTSTVSNADDAVHYQVSLGDARSRLPYLLDGLVVKVNSLDIQLQLGITNRRPNSMIAFKWAAEEVTTVLEGVEWQIGHTGKVSPVAKLKPVRIGGVSVSNALLCNMAEIERLGISIGDRVKVIRAGEVIPKVIGLVQFAESPQQIDPPTQIDGYAVARRKNTDGSDTVDLYVDPRHPAVQRGKVQNWIKKLDIQGIGDEVLDTLMKSNDMFGKPFVSTIGDLYRLHTTSRQGQDLGVLLVNGVKLGAARARKVLANIDGKRELTIDQFLGCLGIDGLGRRRVQLIREAWAANVATDKLGGWRSDALDDVESWFSHATDTLGVATYSHLKTYADKLGIPGIAAELQAGIDAAEPIITDLFSAGVKIKAGTAPIEVDPNSPLKGKSFCFTGVRASGEEITRMAQLGAVEKSGVSRGLTYLVTKDPASTSSKTTKAREVGTEVISYEAFQQLLAA